MPDAHEVWDQQVVTMLKELGGDDLVQQLVSFWEEQQLGDDLPRLRAAAAASDATTLISAAHRIKGSAAQLGLIAVHHAAERIHTAARQGDLPGACAQLPALERALEDANRAMGISRPG